MIQRHPDPPAVAAAAADAVAECARRACAERGRFRIALSGGSTPRLLYERLALPELGAGIDWRRWHVFFSDERCVSPERSESNYRTAREALFDRVPLPEANVHRMLGELEPEVAAAAYEGELGSEPLDLVLLGMGEDGHTASLFPGSSALEERERRVVPGRAPVPPFDRVSFTFRTIAEARRVKFLITGGGKADMLGRVLAQRGGEQPLLPAARVRLEASAVDFYVDDAAAARLSVST
jgi:6-phosphogluconolactonase